LIPGVIKLDFTTGSPLGQFISGGSSKAVTVDISGHSFDGTNAVAAQVKAIMDKVPGAVDADISRDLNLHEIKIEVDREKARSMGLNMRTIADTIKAYIEGDTATKYREKGETYNIFVRLEESSRSSLEDVKSMVIVSPFTGKQIKLSNIAKVNETLGPLEIERQNRERVVRVECNTFKRSMGEVIKDIKSEIKKLVVPADIMIGFGGQAEEQKKAFADMALLLVLSIFLVYMVMASQFESLFDPFIIMFSIPFTFVGVILGMLLFRVTLSIISFLGVVMLMGMVVKNAIVLVSYINILRQRGHSMMEAITLGGKNRLRPVLMTTFTTLFGLFPLAFSRGEGSEVWRPLGITMIGGLSVSTLITLIFIPTIYALFHRKEALNSQQILTRIT
jgi:multidrug efflux pump subunit AcrB